MKKFDSTQLKKLYKPKGVSTGEDNGQVVIIGGSSLFHGAPLLALKVASRINGMVFFASPEESLKEVASDIKSKLMSFVWVPWSDIYEYINKANAILIGPGFMRFKTEKISEEERKKKCDEECRKTKEITKKLLTGFNSKKWIIDAGSLQVMEPGWISEGSILTPNKKEFEMLFNLQLSVQNVQLMSKKYKCVIIAKGEKTCVCSPRECFVFEVNNEGLHKGGMGDVLAGLCVSLFAKNEPFLSASSAVYIAGKAAEELYRKVGNNYNADDMTEIIPTIFNGLVK